VSIQIVDQLLHLSVAQLSAVTSSDSLAQHAGARR
jgi:hypothetical protein